MSKTTKTEKRAIAKDIDNQLKAMKAAADEKLASAKEQLVHNLEMTAEKYRTVNGFMMVHETLGSVASKDEIVPNWRTCQHLADFMSEMVLTLASVIKDTDVTEITGELVDHLHDADFIDREKFTVTEIVRQLLIVNLQQNIGPAVEDIVQFREETARGMESLTQTKAELKLDEAQSGTENPSHDTLKLAK